MNTTVKLCRDCHQPMERATSRQVLCDDCRRKKLEEKRAQVRSLENEDAARRVRHPKAKHRPFKSIAACVREADALGISYGRYVGLGLDKVV